MKLLSKISPELFFLMGALFFGCFHVATNPPLQTPDEFNHFYRAYQISEGKLIAEKRNNRVGGDVPESFESFFVAYRFAATHPEYRFSSFGPDETSLIELEKDKKRFADFPNTAYYSAVSYLPQALTLFALRQFNAKPITLYLVTRVVVFLFWLFGVFFAIKTIPVFKWLFCFLALLPINFIIGVSFSADVVTNVIAFNLVAYVLNLCYSFKWVSNKHVLSLAVLAIFLAMAKLVYVGLIVLFFLIPISKFRTKAHWVLSFLIVLVPALVAAFWWSQVSINLYTPFSHYNSQYVHLATVSEGSNLQQQLNLVLTDKTYFLKVVYKSLFNKDQVYVKSYIGSFGAYMAFDFPQWVYVLAYFGIFLITVSIESPIRLNLISRMVVLFVAMFTFLTMLLSQHLTWDPVGSGYVWLLQGRYFIPIAPLIFAALSGWIKFDLNWMKFIAIVILIVLNTTAISVISQQYIFEQHAVVNKAYSGLEEKNEVGDFVSSVPNILFANQQNYTSLQKRNGKASAMLNASAPFGLTCKLPNVKNGDVIELDLWKKGKGGVAVIAGSGLNCSIYAPNSEFEFMDQAGWKKVHFLYRVTNACDSLYAAFFMYNPEIDTVFVDDITLIHKTNIKQ